MVSKVFILAFNYEEARQYIRKNPGQYVILNRLEQLYGTINPNVIILPNAYRREDYGDYVDVIRSRQGRY
jgi:hypothetical protein